MKILKRWLKRYLTFTLIPHSGRKPIRITISFPFLLFLIILWAGFTLWAGYIASKHFDYLKTKFDKEVLKLKFAFLANNLKRYKNMLQIVHENNQKLKELLGLKSTEKIIQQGEGGPSLEDKIYLEKFLSRKIHELDYKQFKRQLDLLSNEIKLRVAETNFTLSHIKTLQKMYRAVPIGYPTKGNIVSPFGFRVHPVFKFYEFHEGIDIDGTLNTPIYSTADGRVIFVGWEHGYGLLVIVEHDFNFRTYYSHLNKIAVKKWQKVKRGDLLGYMGSTGTSTGIHLHYEVRKNGKSVNPYHYLTPEGFYRREMKSYAWQIERGSQN